MSRIGKKPVAIPAGVTVSLDGSDLSIKGPKGELSMSFVPEVTASHEDDKIVVSPANETKRARSMWGMQRSMVNNIIEGVTNGFSKKLGLQGVGYRAQMKGTSLNLQLGFSHDVNFPVPEGIKIETPDQPRSWYPVSTSNLLVKRLPRSVNIGNQSHTKARVSVMTANMCSARKARRK